MKIMYGLAKASCAATNLMDGELDIDDDCTTLNFRGCGITTVWTGGREMFRREDGSWATTPTGNFATRKIDAARAAELALAAGIKGIAY